MKNLENTVSKIRKDIIWSIYNARSGHPGGSLSCADILAVLFHNVMSPVKTEMNMISDDFFILSKGHAAPALYAVAASKGFITRKELKSLRKLNSPLQGHPDVRHLPWVNVSTGSLGQGISVAAGIAKGLKIKKSKHRVFTLVGDGELQEGQVWETAMFGSHHKLDNLTVIVDYNKLQSDDLNTNICEIEPLGDKWRAFGWNVIEIDGHSHENIYSALSFNKKNEKPTIVIAHTIKGKGVNYMENKPLWHGSVTLSEQQYRDAMVALNITQEEIEEYEIAK